MTPKVILSAGNIARYHYTAIALQRIEYLYRYLCVFSGSNDLSLFKRFLSKDDKKRLQGKYNSELCQEHVRTISLPYLITQGFRRTGLIREGQANALFDAWYDTATMSLVDNCDVFHFVSSAGLKTAKRVKQLGGKIICDVREPYLDFEQGIIKEECNRLGLIYESRNNLIRERVLEEFSLADEFIISSQFVKKTFIQAGFKEEKLHVVPNGVDLSRFCKNSEGEKTNDVFRVLYVGNVIPRKGLYYLVRAFENLNLENSELLVLGNWEPEYRALVEKNIRNSSVRFISSVPQIELREYYKMSDVFVLPSLSDSFAMVITEAMASGLPVIVTENSGAKDLVEEGQEGFVVPIRDVERIQDKLLWMYNHPESRREMGRLAELKVEAFSWKNYMECIIDTYNFIFNGQR